ncbi:MAG: shikimate kinase [Prolixibacteraceae bacterium]|jgi:shikimate kinase|nr:shikimate kinase [Prolixibacteraceae bacterium]
MRIFLTGYMGCGKSTIGRKVAALMGINFTDLDKYIEERYFKSVPDIFAQEGEAAFREKERQALHEVAQFEDIIVGTGGGAPCFFDNMNRMNLAGITIYLAPDNETLACRLLKSKTERPLIAGKSKEELMAFIEVALAKRAPFYEQSKIVIRGINDIQPAEVVKLIQDYLNNNA